MGIFNGLCELAVSPIKATVKTAKGIVCEDWDDFALTDLDILTLGATKVVRKTIKGVGETLKDIDDAFDK